MDRTRPSSATSSRISVGQVLQHATPRTLGGDVALYMGLYGPRFAVQSSDAFAQAIGYPRAPVDDLLVFHTVFGKTVPDISLNADCQPRLRRVPLPRSRSIRATR